MKVVVLGAGLLGVTSAYYLQQLGHEVTVLDRQAAPAAETSFANGGQISVSHAEPWANPSAPFKVLQWLSREDAPLLFRLRADTRQWLWGLQFLRECTVARTRRNIEQIVKLGLYSREMLQALRRETGIAYDHRTQGILHFYTSQKEFDAALKPAELMRELGCERRVVSPEEAVRIEPALAHIRERLAGATYTAEDESGDANLFAREVVRLCHDRGVRFLMSHTVTALRVAGAKIDHVEATNEEGRFQRICGDAFVLALGSVSPLFAAPLGIRLPIYPAKGYSATLDLARDALAPTVSLMDVATKIVYSRLGDRLRVAGTGEFAGYDTGIDPRRSRALVQSALDLFPRLGTGDDASFWAGLRPSTPDGVPIIGASRFANLILNTGHGTLGWTLACGSARIVADLIDGRTPAIDLAGMGAERFARFEK